MIGLKPDKFISPEFSHSAVLGTGPTYTIIHDKGRPPDKVILQVKNQTTGGWYENNDIWQNSSGTSFFGGQPLRSGDDNNRQDINVSRIGGVTEDIRFVLVWY